MLVIIGPSASGKTQIVNELIKSYDLNKMVTYTTRTPRINERNGVDYHFITKAEFKEKLENNFFLEHVLYNDNYYGTAKNELSNDKVVILEKEGLKTYIKEAREQIKIVYVHCSKPIRRLRMISRSDDIDSINKRLNSDDILFDKEVRNLADFIIDTSNSNIYDTTKVVYDYYKKFM